LRTVGQSATVAGMSEKCDALKQIRLTPENRAALEDIHSRYPYKRSFNSLANETISSGLPEMEAEVRASETWRTGRNATLRKRAGTKKRRNSR